MLAAGGAESLKERPHHVPPPVAEETSRCALQGLLTGDSFNFLALSGGDEIKRQLILCGYMLMN